MTHDSSYPFDVWLWSLYSIKLAVLWICSGVIIAARKCYAEIKKKKKNRALTNRNYLLFTFHYIYNSKRVKVIKREIIQNTKEVSVLWVVSPQNRRISAQTCEISNVFSQPSNAAIKKICTTLWTSSQQRQTFTSTFTEYSTFCYNNLPLFRYYKVD